MSLTSSVRVGGALRAAGLLLPHDDSSRLHPLGIRALSDVAAAVVLAFAADYVACSQGASPFRWKE